MRETQAEFTMPIASSVSDVAVNDDAVDDLSTVTAITIKDEQGQELQLVRQNDEDDITQYRELEIASIAHLSSSAVKVAVTYKRFTRIGT